MPRLLQRLFRRRTIRFGLKRDARGRLRDPRFVSFLSQANRRTLDTDLQDAVLRGRRWLKHGLVLALVAGFAWVAVESAMALSRF